MGSRFSFTSEIFLKPHKIQSGIVLKKKLSSNAVFQN